MVTRFIFISIRFLDFKVGSRQLSVGSHQNSIHPSFHHSNYPLFHSSLLVFHFNIRKHVILLKSSPHISVVSVYDNSTLIGNPYLLIVEDTESG